MIIMIYIKEGFQGLLSDNKEKTLSHLDEKGFFQRYINKLAFAFS